MQQTVHICKLSRVSNGTFYHLYKSKDDLMVEYLKCARNYKECSMNGNDLIGYIVALNLSLAECYIEMGVEFASNFHNPKNQVFNPYTRPAKGYALDYYLDKLIEAQKQGLVTDCLSIDEIVMDITTIIVGNAFEWCATNGVMDYKSHLKRMLETYLYGIFTEKYFENLICIETQ